MSAFTLRKATLEDRPVLERLIAESAHGLSFGDYTREQIDAALGTAFGVDTQLILDGTYFVVEDEHKIVACGGWSHRKTLFGGDSRAGREPELLEPGRDAAKIRAFFVRPGWSRRGIGRELLDRCEREARASGFRAMELMATLPGRRLYEACGYTAGEPVEHRLRAGVTIEFVPMRKELTLTRAEVVAVFAALVEAWNRRDPEGFANLFAPDGSTVGFDGSPMNGRGEIASTLRAIFADHQTATYVARIREVRALDADTTLLRAVAGMIPRGQTDLNPAANAVQSLVAVRESGQPRIALFHNTPAAFHGRPHLAESLTQELTAVARSGSVVAEE